MDFNVILLMLLPIFPAILWLKSSVPALNKIWSAISWQFSAQNDIKYIRVELARMKAFLEKAEGDPETAKNKRELISQIRELAYDAEDCIDEFKRLLVQPTDQEIFRCVLSTGVLLSDGAGTWLLKIGTWLLGTSAGILLCGAVTCYFLGIGTCVRFLGIVLELGTPLLIRTAVELHGSFIAALELGFPLLIRTGLDPLLRTGHLHLTDHEILGLFLRIGDLLWITGAVTFFLKISTCFLVLKISTCFLRRQLQRLCNRFLRSARARFLEIGLQLRTCFERDTYWLRTGVVFSTRFLRKVHAQYQIKIEVQRIKASSEQEHIREMRHNVIPKASNAPSGSLLGQYPSQLNAHFIHDSELVGINKLRDKLLNLLLDGNEAQTCVISVVGCGGLGKTTLVRKIFESFGHVEYCLAWITVSASFELMGFLKKVFQELNFGGFNQELGEVKLIKQIRDHLHDKRYVIIFDDVWTVDAWKNIELVFPVNMRGSRIVVTTRDENVAHAACVRNHEHVIKLPSLSEVESMELFCKIVFEGNPCPDDLQIPSENILKKCRGVPLAIKAMGGVLARKPRTTNDWNDILHRLSWALQNVPELKEMTQIMTLSYEALPDYHLKQCFLYLSIFPEDYVINCKQLQALWIAEGMVGHDNDRTPEEVAESYLKEFVCRNMIQASRISDRGRVKWCQVHDVILEFTISKSTKLNLVTHVGKHGASSVLRRLCLHDQSTDVIFPFENSRSDHLRSLCWFGDEYAEPHSQRLVSFIRSSRLLRVLELGGIRWLKSSHIVEIGKLYHLKYLGLRETGVDRVPESFGGLQNLETLDLRWLDSIIVPVEVFNLPKLRHLRSFGLIAEGGLGSSKTLQTLNRLELRGREGEVQELRSLTQLRNLRLWGLGPEQGSDFCASISGMSNCLRSLKVTFDARRAMGYLDSLDSSPPKLLQTLGLYGYLGRLPGWISSNSLQAVSKIEFSYSGLKFDAIQALQKLPNLVRLALYHGSYVEKELHFDGEGFGRLKTLRLYEIESLESVAFGVGSMPSLHVLHIDFCKSLYKVGKFDRGNLPRLNEVSLAGNSRLTQELREIAKAHPNNPKFYCR